MKSEPWKSTDSQSELPPGSEVVLERARRAGQVGVTTDDLLVDGPDAAMLAERLVDLGLLRVQRAGHYTLTEKVRPC